MNYLFACCFKDSTEPNSSNVLKEPITTESIVLIADELEEAVLENILEPGLNGVVKKITGQDISGVIHNFVKKDVEPVVEKVLNPAVEVCIEKLDALVVTPVLQKVDSLVNVSKNKREILQRNESKIIKKG